MILVDTSIWVEHLSRGNRVLAPLLDAKTVLAHPYVIGEIALGSLGPREAILSGLHELPQAAIATHQEVMHLVEQRRLFGIGIGYVDAHLLASARLMGRVPIWTYDKRLQAAASNVGLAYGP